MVLPNAHLLLYLLHFRDELARIGKEGVKESFEGKRGLFAGPAQLEEYLVASHLVALGLEVERQIIEEVEDLRQVVC